MSILNLNHFFSHKQKQKTFEQFLFKNGSCQIPEFSPDEKEWHPCVVTTETIYLNSCHHVVAFLWAKVSCRLVVEDACFSMRITLGVVFIRSLVCAKCVPGRLRSGCGMAWINGFMRKSSRRDYASNMRFSALLNSWDNFFVNLPSISSEIWVMCSSCDLGTFEFCAKLLLG